MSTIPESNFRQFLSKEVNLSSNVLTDTLGTIHRFNIFSRISRKNELDSRQICKNIENSIKFFNLSAVEMTMAAKNLSLMQRKFSTSPDRQKAQECIATITRINQFIEGRKQASVQPASRPSQPSKAQVKKTSGQKKEQPRETASTKPQVTTNKRISPSVTTTSAGMPASQKDSKTLQSLRKQNSEKFTAQQGVVNAISRNNQREETTVTQVKGHAPNTDRIQQLEKDLSEALRKQTGDYVKMVHYPWNEGCKFFYVALRKEQVSGFEVVKHVLVPAVEIDQLMKQRATIGTFDVGALLREQRQKMKLPSIPIEIAK